MGGAFNPDMYILMIGISLLHGRSFTGFLLCTYQNLPFEYIRKTTLANSVDRLDALANNKIRNESEMPSHKVE